jgi:enoyl-CoA hydratase/carnithine racemase
MADSKDVILYEKRDRVAYITMNRPEVLNAGNRAMYDKLNRTWLDFRDDPEMLVAIVTGAGGRAFSTGADLKEINRRQSEGMSAWTGEGENAGEGEEAGRSLNDLKIWKPIIAAVDGYCVAGGLELSLMCDIRVASEQSKFGLQEPRWNLLARYGLHNLSRMIPLGEAMYMQLTGSRISAQEAYRIGLIHSVHPDRESTMVAAQQIADEIKLCGPMAVQAIKRIVMTCRNLPVEYSTKFTEDIERQLQGMEDSIEGPRAFAEKRLPLWKGR